MGDNCERNQFVPVPPAPLTHTDPGLAARPGWLERLGATVSEAIEDDCDGLNSLDMARHLLALAMPTLRLEIEAELRQQTARDLLSRRDNFQPRSTLRPGLSVAAVLIRNGG